MSTLKQKLPLNVSKRNWTFYEIGNELLIFGRAVHHPSSSISCKGTRKTHVKKTTRKLLTEFIAMKIHNWPAKNCDFFQVFFSSRELISTHFSNWIECKQLKHEMFIECFRFFFLYFFLASTGKQITSLNVRIILSLCVQLFFFIIHLKSIVLSALKWKTLFTFVDVYRSIVHYCQDNFYSFLLRQLFLIQFIW